MLIKQQIAIRPLAQLVIGGVDNFDASVGVLVALDNEGEASEGLGRSYGLRLGWAAPNSIDHGGDFWHRWFADWEGGGGNWTLTLLGFKLSFYWGW